MLRDMGLIRGASDACAIILTRQGVVNGPLRFADEFVRHKVLDLIGDLALAGRRIQGRVVAERAGHAMHTALVKRLLRDRSAWELAFGYDEVPEKVNATLLEMMPVHA
jgi:UDP-3-O-[3-hydroxymyristoyl] N-acetylglucosamine deacetylase